MQNKQLSVVQIIDRLNIGGAERITITLSNILQEHGHTVKVITTVSPGPLAKQLHANIIFISLDRKWKWNPFTMRRLINEIKNFDVIHVHSIHNLRYLFLAATLFGMQKKIFYHEHHGASADKKPTWIQKKLYAGTIFIAVSEKLKTWAVEKLNMPVKNVFILPNIALKEKTIITSSNDNNLKRLAVISNFIPSKNLEFAVELFNCLLKTSAQQYHLTLIGQVADIIYFQKIKEEIVKKKLAERINIITDCENIQSILHNYVLALHTSFSESGPLVLIECLAQGLPFVSYNTGEVAEQIKNTLPQFVMDSFNKELWVERIEKILCVPKDELRKELLHVYDALFSAEKYYEKCLTIYKSILGNQG